MRRLSPEIAAPLAALILTMVVLGATARPHDIDWGGDFAGYLLQAKALAAGDPQAALDYGAFRFENSTKSLLIGPPIYPWGLALLMAPIAAAGGDADRVQWLVGLCHVGAAAMAWALFARRIDWRFAALIVAMTGLSYGALATARAPISDTPFTFFALAALFALSKATIRERDGPLSLVWPLAAGALIACAIEVRAAGLALLLAAPVSQLFELVVHWRVRSVAQLRQTPPARWIEAASLYVVALAIIAIIAMLPGGLGVFRYKDHFVFASLGVLVQSLIHMSLYYAKTPDAVTHIPIIGAWLNILVLAPLAVIGAAHRARRDYPFLAFAAIYLAALIVLPFENGLRMILPVMPLYLYFAVAGGLAVESRLRKGKHGVTLAGAALIAAATIATSVALNARDLKAPVEGPYEKEAAAIFQTVSETVPEDAAVIFFKPRVLKLFTGRSGILQLDAAGVRQSPADFILLYGGETEPAINAKLSKIVAGDPSGFALVAENSKFRLYRIVKGGAAGR
jgi:hypothetical protein